MSYAGALVTAGSNPADPTISPYTTIQQSAAGNLYYATVSMTINNVNGLSRNNLPYYPSSVTYGTFSTSYSTTGTINTGSGSYGALCGINLVGQVLQGRSVNVA